MAGRGRAGGVPLILLITWAYLDRGFRATLGTILRLSGIIYHTDGFSLSLSLSLSLAIFLSPSLSFSTAVHMAEFVLRAS